MLILSRRIGETIVIDQNIQIKVLDVKGGQVRIGVEAPRGVAVDRLEIAERKALGLSTAQPDAALDTNAEELLFGNRTVDEWRELLAAEAGATTGEPSHG